MFSAEELHAKMNELGMNQTSLAIEADVNQSLISEFFSGKRKSLRHGNYVKICEALGLKESSSPQTIHARIRKPPKIGKYVMCDDPLPDEMELSIDEAYLVMRHRKLDGLPARLNESSQILKRALDDLGLDNLALRGPLVQALDILILSLEAARKDNKK